jgi:hypothetical protein
MADTKSRGGKKQSKSKRSDSKRKGGSSHSQSSDQARRRSR